MDGTAPGDRTGAHSVPLSPSRGGGGGDARGGPPPGPAPFIRRRPRVPRALGAAAPRTHLCGSTTSPRPRPPPGARGTRAGVWPPAGTTGGAARGRAGGAGRARPGAAGRSRVAAGSDTCRAPLPAPPRPLARRGSGARPRRASRAGCLGRTLAGSGEVLGARGDRAAAAAAAVAAAAAAVAAAAVAAAAAAAPSAADRQDPGTNR